ncbi:D-alanyl-D-alanine carboxypeptidase family protein [Sporanaerobacter acetigenes]|uniref:serine-type D-Ala-D-Ala carboxypeptidase n=1 Tax=Sporanaerobacter acetigenes DSM 13106 TaxID=1123281 RepID=A0A1M5XN00_9FIRM|nr:D-alanyl-D-alanine carboxypeptidase family protein [Sporanaerobacter acetigenes]SHI01225.1 D-alanyl-D-alanine carboxypeptidase (penicillin-binding protein 5/6) [Sporanaerobacter acetigenes DSM 13106]
MIFLHKNKRYFSAFLGILILLSSINISSAEPVFEIDGKSAILIDYNSGNIIYEKNSHDKLPPASITKIMVLLIAMESLERGTINLNDEVVISGNAAGMGGSQVYLEEGEIQTIENLLKAICLRSANDASVALAEHMSGSEELFVKKMNEHAKELGMNNTNFMNVTGLPNEGHYTTAYDIGIMSKELLKHPKIHDWLNLWMSEMKVGKNKDVVQSLVNTNRLIRDYEGANGIKTGSTSEAGFCLSASAKRGNLQLIAVILGCETSKIRFNETKKLLDYGFANYDSITVGRKNDLMGKVLVEKGSSEEVEAILERDACILLPKGSEGNLEKEIIISESILAPVDNHEKLGELIIKFNGKEIDKINIIAKNSVDKANFKDMLKKVFDNLLKK